MIPLTHIFNFLGMLCGILFAYFRMLDAGQTTKDREKTKWNYFIAWRKIETSRINALPDVVILFYLSLWLKLQIFFLKIRANKFVDVLAKNKLILILIYISMNLYVGINFNPETNIYLFLSKYLILSLFSLFIAIFYTNLNKFSMMATIFSFSIFISYSAMWIGNLNEFFTNSNKSFVIVGINFICDTITISFTYHLLLYAYRSGRGRLLFYFFIVLFDIFIASILSVISLLIINWFLDLNYTLANVQNIFFGYSLDGTIRNLEGWFWLSHTTLLPTIFYLSVFILALIGKELIIPLGKKIGKASVVDKPHYYTATMFGFLGLVFIAMSGFIAWIS